MEISIVQTSGVGADVDIPAELAAELHQTYEALKDLPVNRAAVVDFDTKAEATVFVRQCEKFAKDKGIGFRRTVPGKERPTRVSFRLYVLKENKPKDPKTGKTVKKSTRQAASAA